MAKPTGSQQCSATKQLVDILGNLLGTESNPLVVKIAGASSDAPHIVSGAYDSSGNLVFTLSDGSTLPPIAPPAGGPTTAPVSISGFYLNGASSPKLKAAVSRIKAGTGRGRMVMKGDSTTVGQGAGSTADGYGLTGARPNRIAKVLAGLLTSAGTPTLDGSLVSDNGMWVANNFSLLDYDSRAVLPINWTIYNDKNFAGSGFFSGGGGQVLTITPDTAVDTFEIAYYNSVSVSIGVKIDGSVPASGPASINISSSSGLSKAIVRAPSPGTHTLTLTAGGAGVAVRSITAYNSNQSAMDILVHAALGANTWDQSASNASGWGNNDSLGFDAPDFTTVNLGLNDMSQGVGVSDYSNNLNAIVNKA